MEDFSRLIIHQQSYFHLLQQQQYGYHLTTQGWGIDLDQSMKFNDEINSLSTF